MAPGCTGAYPRSRVRVPARQQDILRPDAKVERVLAASTHGTGI